ncbi:hypothetical protein NE237_026906 [Protea cynaroides]|uniref:Uncharacterized protein n=1 Tax=Protea cynaroides TaxID=273540 RepID=A0A9Q0JRF2_9MAGN|nr:hypothetical protein NE237_026906 [Protea cynaroides]
MGGSGLGLGFRLLNRRMGLEFDRVSDIRFQVRTILSVSDLCRYTITSFSFSGFSSVASPAKPSDSNPLIIDYLVEALGLSKTQALSASKRFVRAKDSKKPESVVHFLRQLGFSEDHIRDAVRVSPQILFADIEKTLKPKLQLFQEIGLTGSDLGRYISKNSGLLCCSLDRRLTPCMEILKKIFYMNNDHQGLILVLQRCKWVLSIEPEARLLPNISLLERHGVFGSQLSRLFRRQPTLFVMRQSQLRDLISRVIEMGFTADSRMFVHALHTIGCLSSETLRRKFNLLRGLSFSEEECMTMFKKMPVLFRCSEEKLKLGIEVFMNVIGFEKTVLVHRPTFLMHSLEKRVIPRYRVFEILKSKRLLKKRQSFIQALDLTEEKFIDKFLSRFKDDAEELLVAYKEGKSVPLFLYFTLFIFVYFFVPGLILVQRCLRASKRALQVSWQNWLRVAKFSIDSVYILRKIERRWEEGFVSIVSKRNNNENSNKDAAIEDDDVYNQLEKLDFMTAAKILFGTPPKKRKFGVHVLMP